jgi:hypothetical protein
MRITESQLRRIVREEMLALEEMSGYDRWKTTDIGAEERASAQAEKPWPASSRHTPWKKPGTRPTEDDITALAADLMTDIEKTPNVKARYLERGTDGVADWLSGKGMGSLKWAAGKILDKVRAAGAPGGAV